MTEKEVAKRKCEEFVRKRTSKTVSVSISNSTVKIKPTEDLKSLGKFWVEVLQHPSNYPKEKNTYEELSKRNQIELKVEDIHVSIFSTTGCLMIQGTDADKWFLKTFSSVMERYNYEIPFKPKSDSHKEEKSTRKKRETK